MRRACCSRMRSRISRMRTSARSMASARTCCGNVPWRPTSILVSRCCSNRWPTRCSTMWSTSGCRRRSRRLARACVACCGARTATMTARQGREPRCARRCGRWRSGVTSTRRGVAIPSIVTRSSALRWTRSMPSRRSAPRDRRTTTSSSARRPSGASADGMAPRCRRGLRARMRSTRSSRCSGCCRATTRSRGVAPVTAARTRWACHAPR